MIMVMYAVKKFRLRSAWQFVGTAQYNQLAEADKRRNKGKKGALKVVGVVRCEGKRRGKSGGGRWLT